MKRTISQKLIAPMVGILLIAALGVSWTYSWVQERNGSRAAQHDVAIFQAGLLDLLALTQDQLSDRMKAELRLLQDEAHRLGAGARGPLLRAGDRVLPDLRFGRTSQASFLARMEGLSTLPEATLTVLALQGQDFVRLSCRGSTPDGGQAPGSSLDPAGAVGQALRKGRTYWGPDGPRQYTCYEPIRDARGALIGAFGISAPLGEFSMVYRSVRQAMPLGGVLLALLDAQGHPLYAGASLSAEELRTLLRTGRSRGVPWVVRRQVFQPWGATILAAMPPRQLRYGPWMVRASALASALALAAALTLSYYLVLRRHLLRPLGEVLDVLGMISFYQQYDIRFRQHRDGEVGVLTSALNGMLDQIRLRDTKLLSYQEHLEDLVGQRLEQLTQAKQLLAATLDALPAHIAILDAAGTVLVTNRLWEQSIASTNPFMAGAGVGMDYLGLCRSLAPLPTQCGPVAEQIALVIQERQAALGLEYELETEEPCHWFTVLATAFQVQGAARIVLMHMDVTEQRRMEIQLHQAQKLESIGQLASGIAHEINTPTQYLGDNLIFLSESFRNLVDLLEPLRLVLESTGPEPCPPELAESARRALAETDLGYLQLEVPRALVQCQEGIRRISSIVSAMKDFSHPGGTNKAPTDLNRAIESTTLVCRGEWKYVADLELDLAPALPLVMCLQDGINQVILNLVINAAHAIAEANQLRHESKGRIRIQTRATGDAVQIIISDTGTGIPEAIRDRIFDPFFTTKPVGKGTGQGLAIAYSVIVKQHGGSITLESEPGRGSTFTVTLPVQDLPEQDQP